MEPFAVEWDGHRAALLTSETAETGSAITLPDHRLSR
jgi:hypothetical protein